MLSVEYIAGFFDGEGCISFSVQKSHINIEISMSNANREVLEEIRQTIGCGKIYKLRGAYTLCFTTHRSAWKFLMLVGPHLRVKRLLALETANLLAMWKEYKTSSQEELKLLMSILEREGRQGTKAYVKASALIAANRNGGE